MHTDGCAVRKSLLVVGAFTLAALPVSAQRISADAVKNGHFPQAIAHLDARPDKSIHRLPTTGNAAGSHSAAAAAKPADPPRPIVSPFFETSSRSNSVNYGFLVGGNPFSDDSKNATVKTYVVPLVIKVHQVATDFSTDANGYLTLSGIKDQDAIYYPTQASPACLGNKNNVPFTLAGRSPIFQDHHWVWGGTDLGVAKYNEAFQRANFWNATGQDPGDYITRLDPKVLPPLVIDFPKGSGIGLPQTSTLTGFKLLRLRPNRPGGHQPLRRISRLHRHPADGFGGCQLR